MLNPPPYLTGGVEICQPPSGGCVLKLKLKKKPKKWGSQPPSGGCVLKLYDFINL